MQVHGSEYNSLVQCARQVFRTEGLGAFYISYPTTLTMTVPFTAAQFMAYESLSRMMNPSKKYDPLTHCVAGGLAGGAAAAVTTPLDVIKTLLQTRGTVKDPEIRNANGLMQAARIIKARNGWAGFFRGLRPRILQTMPSTAICWYVKLYSFACKTHANTTVGQRMRWRKHTSSGVQRRPRKVSGLVCKDSE